MRNTNSERRIYELGEDDPDSRQKSKKEMLLAEAREKWGDFFKRFGGTIGAYFGTPDITITVEPGGWYIDLKNIRMNVDPTFFLEQGYSESESLFATFHEAERFRDMTIDPYAYTSLFDRIDQTANIHKAYPDELSKFYNCLDDVLVNKKVMKRWKAGIKAKNVLYPKLFHSNNLTKHPFARQFMYALLRREMIPSEEVIVHEEVQAALEKWDLLGGAQRNATAILTAVNEIGDAQLPPMKRFAIIETLAEPLFKDLFLRDIERYDKEKADGEPGDPFGVDPDENVIFDPMKARDALKGINELKAKNEKIKNDSFKEKMGVEKIDFLNYAKDVRKVEEHIDTISEVFRKIIQKRKTYRRKLRKASKDGVLLDSRKTATAVAEIKSGHAEPVVMLDFEKQETIGTSPNKLEFTIVCDGSGSMVNNGKTIQQRLFAILAMEAFAHFQKQIDTERTNGDDINLTIQSELRMFSDSDILLKPLSSNLTHKERVEFRSKLINLPGGSNNEVTTFNAITDEQFNRERINSIVAGETKKIIIFLTDGESDTSAIQAARNRMMNLVRRRDGSSSLVIAGIGFDGGQSAVSTYAPDGYYANSIDELPTIFETFISKILSDI